jgi:uncharacterized membrane protein YgcG
VSAADVNNFSIRDYEINYTLDRDANGKSTLLTEEVITAEFPNFDQNRGIERAIPSSYDGHTTNLKILSIEDQYGAARKYTTYDSGGGTVVRIGDADIYVRGIQVYKITYSQTYVTKFFADANKDEFYWDTNGTDWRVPIDSLRVTLNVANNLQLQLDGSKACYFGEYGSTAKCEIAQDGMVFTVTQENIRPNQNVTLAVGFQPGTFTAYKPSTTETLFVIWIFLFLLTGLISIFVIIWLSFSYTRQSNRSSEVGSIIPEYIPPKNASVTIAGMLLNKQSKLFSAQVIDLAVRHYLKITETRQKAFFKSANYSLEIIRDTSKLREEEQELLRDIFVSPEVGKSIDTDSLKKDYAMGIRISDNTTKATKNIKTLYNLRATDDLQTKKFRTRALVILLVAVLTLSPGFLVAALIALVMSFTLKPLTDIGLELKRYILGMEMYIKVAEEERLKILQSPEGAAEPIDTTDNTRMIKLYERMLPYAILFGLEKEWSKRLGDYYETTNAQPNWYSGNNAVFNAVVLTSAISSFNSTTSYANSSSSGSGGGGSSGGGGGGGGGGGW